MTKKMKIYIKDRSEISGSDDEAFTSTLIHQIAGGAWLADTNDKDIQHERMNALLTALKGLKPRDELEGMMATQMVGLHNAAMECMRRAMIEGQTFEGRNANLNQANKLTRSYAAMVDTLNRYRGKGVSEQKMTVEHVHVHAGGQAIVGNVEKPHKEGGRGNYTKGRTTPCNKHYRT